jgi:hypothetical protein
VNLKPRKIRPTCSSNSLDSVATVTATTAQPASSSERVRIVRQTCKKTAALGKEEFAALAKKAEVRAKP